MRERSGSPSPTSSSANSAPTSTVSPGRAARRARRPAAGAGISTSTLSVLTSQTGSSASTQSPGRLRHSTIVPSATEMPICGISILTTVSVGEELTAGLLHVLELGQDRALQRWAERDRHVGRGQGPDRAVEVLGGLGAD